MMTREQTYRLVNEVWTPEQEAAYQRMDSMSLECHQGACSGCDGLKRGSGNQPCAHECHQQEP